MALPCRNTSVPYSTSSKIHFFISEKILLSSAFKMLGKRPENVDDDDGAMRTFMMMMEPMAKTSKSVGLISAQNKDNTEKRYNKNKKD